MTLETDLVRRAFCDVLVIVSMYVSVTVLLSVK
jgi:hypothetical protein